ncbi:nucleotidyl transferase AbiEii/AbiGii toxin family protein [Paenibacillus sp. LS1]|uniref:nucleotidyl transferase AbiEii/AbiGii toxin family protein n=1 Tax=Paenibacillus sp. LS1 TaxID=2992120 RepID=UPI00222F70D3|nr:nucleotidyl transferase AbiEii/AbiGii toxin family protein [Paenibacillus sp. LS1]MCW3791424.1 nucleotidyl transferase AbiEii/AbiGii toxin family protein [Paenibacillus sp. LS1]
MSGKSVQLHTLNEDERFIVVLEALLKRASLVNSPFVLKGSLLTRQYLENPNVRYVDDIDFLYTGRIETEDQANEIFTDWMIRVTEMDLNDGIVFRSFRENAFWRRIDYAMADDFPTVNTELAFYIDSEPRVGNEYKDEDELHLDISFNLELDEKSVALSYQPMVGEAFIVPHTVPLSIQIAWKLHQTIVRPRFKDLYDLQHLLSNPSYDQQALKETLQTLVNECNMDPAITREAMKKVLVDDLHDVYLRLNYDYDLQYYAGSRSPEVYFMEFVSELRQTMNHAGINNDAYEHLPNCSTHK